MGEEEKTSGKETKIFEKVEEEDYRGMLSLILGGGYVVGIVIGAIIRPESIAIISGVLGPLVGAVVGWYFREKVGK